MIPSIPLPRNDIALTNLNLHDDCFAMYWKIQMTCWVTSDSLFCFVNTHQWDANISFSFSGELVLSTTYGLEIASKDDKYIKLAKAGVDPILPALNPGTYLVDFIPALKYIPDWVPGAGFKKTAKECRVRLQIMRDSPYEDAKHQIVSAIFIPHTNLYGSSSTRLGERNRKIIFLF